MFMPSALPLICTGQDSAVFDFEDVIGAASGQVLDVLHIRDSHILREDVQDVFGNDILNAQ